MTIEQPSGTVTFLLSDIEGSTRLLAELGTERYASALDDHRRLLRAAFERHCGYEVDYEGDAFVVAFQRARQALAAAAEAQQALSDHPWPDGQAIRVRMGIHSGEPLLAPPKYVGLDLHKTARIMAAGHGGQVLVSQATKDRLDSSVELFKLGSHRLKDFAEPEPLYQLGQGRFPPVKSLSNTNLPRPVSLFVGREAEIAELVGLLRTGTRLLSLTGPGGSGKTRLAIEAATEVVPAFRDGVVWVPLASVRDPALVLDEIARALGAQGDLADHVRERELLLLLDNFEQVIEAAAGLADLAEACPKLQLLVTTRESLRVRGELEYRVPPLAAPEAVELFCARADLKPDQSVADLCATLDNLPLALELAAARASVLTPKQILDRLSERLDLFRAGRDADPRQATLRATIEWSYELLTEEERIVFARLGGFVGGFSLEAAEAVCPTELETVAALVDKNLVRQRDGRFFMLETIREYAEERLAADPDAPAVRLRHAHWLLALAEEAERHLRTREEAHWFGVLALEDANFRAGFAALEVAGEWRLLGRLAAALGRYWYYRHALLDGEWAMTALQHVSEPGRLRARLLTAATYVRGQQWRLDEVEALARERIKLYHALGDPAEEAEAQSDLGLAMLYRGDLGRAKSFLQAARMLARDAGAPWALALALSNLADVALQQGDYNEAVEVGEEAVKVAEEVGEPGGIALALVNVGTAACLIGRFNVAQARFADALKHAGRAGYTRATMNAMEGLAAAICAKGDPSSAARLLGHAQALRHETGSALQGVERRLHDETVAALEERLSSAELREAMARGAAHSVDELVDSVVSVKRESKKALIAGAPRPASF